LLFITNAGNTGKKQLISLEVGRLFCKILTEGATGRRILLRDVLPPSARSADRVIEQLHVNHVTMMQNFVMMPENCAEVRSE
jgi:hypothetical protein